MTSSQEEGEEEEEEKGNKEKKRNQNLRGEFNYYRFVFLYMHVKLS